MNKKKREILWLMLPMLFLGAWGLVRPSFLNFNPLNSEPRDLREGKLRLEMESFKRLDPTPLDVAQGYTAIFQTKVWQKGALPQHPKTIRSLNTSFAGKEILEYRTGKVWHNVRVRDDGNTAQKIILLDSKAAAKFHGYRTLILRFDLRAVPDTAEEIRWRQDWFFHLNLKNNEGCVEGQNPFLNNVSDCQKTLMIPFQVSMKNTNGVLLKPEISRDKEVEPLGLVWVRRKKQEHFYLRLKHLKNEDWNGKKYAFFNLNVKDANGNPVTVWHRNGRRRWQRKPLAEGKIEFSQGWLGRPVEIPLFSEKGVELGEGVETLALPLTVSGEVSDGKCWPVPFSFKVRPEKFEREELGAP